MTVKTAVPSASGNQPPSRSLCKAAEKNAKSIARKNAVGSTHASSG